MIMLCPAARRRPNNMEQAQKVKAMEIMFPEEMRIESDPRPHETMAGLLVSVVEKARDLHFSRP